MTVEEMKAELARLEAIVADPSRGSHSKVDSAKRAQELRDMIAEAGGSVAPAKQADA